MIELNKTVSFASTNGSRITGRVVGRTIQADPRYDVILPDGEIIKNIAIEEDKI
tara:strand:- start:236 stop:397 length:162 start_codon:yes stop_codon:yes gene_type:complete